MMPVGINTQVAPSTQVSLVAPAAVGTNLVHLPSTVVAPSVQSGSITPDHKGNGGYASQAVTPTTSAPISLPLTILIPSSLSTSSATLGTATMFATQLMAQDAGAAAPLLAVYEELVAASQVKYKPSMASLPEPAPNNLFAKMLAEETSHSTLRDIIQNIPKEVMAQTSQQAAASSTSRAMAQAPQPKSREVATPSYSGIRQASQSYSATSVRNQVYLDETPVEAISG